MKNKIFALLLLLALLVGCTTQCPECPACPASGGGDIPVDIGAVDYAAGSYGDINARSVTVGDVSSAYNSKGDIYAADDITAVDSVTAADITASDDLVVTDDVDINGDIDVDGTANLDDLDVDASGEIEIDGGLTDFGGGSCSVADGDNDVCVAAVLEVDGELELDGALDADSTANIAGNLTLQALLLSSFANITVTNGYTLTPTVNTYALDSAGAVTMTLAASASEGQWLILIGDDANTITINDTNLRSSDGNAITLGQYDVAILVYQDSEWLLVSSSANS